MYNMKIKKSLGFHLYLLEFMENKKKPLNYYKSFEAIRSLANISWNSLPKERREFFKKEAEKTGCEKIEKKLDEIIQQFTSFEEQERQKALLYSKKIDQYLEDTFNSFNWNSHVFLIGHVNYQAKIKEDFYPNEIGLVKYSLDKGNISTLHIHLNSGILPIGNENYARIRSEDTHQLPVNSNFGISYENAKKQIDEFIGNEDGFIFTLNEDEDILAAIDLFGKASDKEIYVAPLEKLFYYFYKNCKSTSITIDMARDTLLNNPWTSYDIGCNYHLQKGSSKFCSLAKAKRWAYYISKQLLPPQLMYPEKHFFNVIR